MQDAQTRICWNSGTGVEFRATAVSEFSLNLAAANKEIGISKLILHILIKTGFDALTSGVNLQLIDDTNQNLTTAMRVLLEISAVAVGDMTAKKHYMIPVPPRKLKQFLGFRFEVISGDNPSNGAIIAWFDEQAESEVV